MPAIVADLTPLRESRDFRRLVLGNVVTGLGTQAALVALPYQLYVETGSAFLVGLLGAVELAPLIVMALWGGALADRADRRRLLLLDQIGLVVCAALLAGVTFALDEPPIWSLYVLAGALAGFGAVQNVVRSAIVPNLVEPGQLKNALALSYGLFNLTVVLGPALGGLMIGWLGVGSAYVADGVSCLAMVVAALALPPQPPLGLVEGAAHPPVLESIREGLAFVRREDALMGSFAIDLMAMAFGMPRALFPVLALDVFHAGPEGAGLLAASVSAGAVVAALTTGWMAHARRLGRIVLWAVAAWGAAIALAGISGSLWLAVALFAVAGAADSVSAVCRQAITQTVTPDHLRGRMSSVFSLVVTSGPRLGDVESGTVAGLAGPRFSVVSGGAACVVGVAAIAVAFPALRRYDSEQAEAEAAARSLAAAPAG